MCLTFGKAMPRTLSSLECMDQPRPVLSQAEPYGKQELRGLKGRTITDLMPRGALMYNAQTPLDTRLDFYTKRSKGRPQGKNGELRRLL